MSSFYLDWAGLAVSLFTTISLLWLGLTILLNGNRRAAGTWLIGVGMLLGAAFFTSHTWKAHCLHRPWLWCGRSGWHVGTRDGLGCGVGRSPRRHAWR